MLNRLVVKRKKLKFLTGPSNILSSLFKDLSIVSNLFNIIFKRYMGIVTTM